MATGGGDILGQVRAEKCGRFQNSNIPIVRITTSRFILFLGSERDVHGGAFAERAGQSGRGGAKIDIGSAPP